MDKASNALRRSGVRIRSIGSGHGDLQMVIAQLGDAKTATKAFVSAQEAFFVDLAKWADKEDNLAIQDAFKHLGELASLWSEVQTEFIQQLKSFKHNYEMILEGERNLNTAKNNLDQISSKTKKLRKEIQKGSSKLSCSELELLTTNLSDSVKEEDDARMILSDQIHEKEVIKMIRVKDSIEKLSSAYCDMSSKCQIIFSSAKAIANALPNLCSNNTQNIHNLKYTGYAATSTAVDNARKHLGSYCRSLPTLHKFQPPPPVNPFYSE